MEYKIIKKQYVDDNGNDKVIFRIKEKNFLGLWSYTTLNNKKSFIDSLLAGNGISIFLIGFFSIVGIIPTFNISYIFLWVFGNIPFYFLVKYNMKDTFKTQWEAEDLIKKMLKKKNNIISEEVVSVIKLKNNNLTIEK